MSREISPEISDYFGDSYPHPTTFRDLARRARSNIALNALRGVEVGLVRVLEALDALRPGGELVVLHERRPIFLYPQLEERGFVHETDEPTAGVIRIRIRHGESSKGA